MDTSENSHFRPNLSEDLQQCINQKSRFFTSICKKQKRHLGIWKRKAESKTNLWLRKSIFKTPDFLHCESHIDFHLRFFLGHWWHTKHTSFSGGWNAGGRMGEDQQPPGQRQGASCRQAAPPFTTIIKGTVVGDFLRTFWA